MSRTKNRPTHKQCLGCLRMAGVARVIDGTELDICPECEASYFDRTRALDKARGLPAGIQRVES